jgi:lysyl-tRNA synthetase class 2
MTWWHPQNFEDKKPFLMKRQAVIKAIRRFFDAQDFYEVETPILQICPVIDAHIHGFKTMLRGVDLKDKQTLYLQTSPEFDMKKLMVAGVARQYQIARVFRNGEESKRHSPEFTMLEWYRTDADYNDIMDDCEGLLKACARAADIPYFMHGDMQCDPFKPWQKISVADAFLEYADIELSDYLDDRDGFAAIIREQGIRVADDDRWDDLFFRVMAEKIEPFLGKEVPAFLYDYPLSMASLSRPKTSDPRYAERFELYVCGVELANAFSELTDAQEQLRRYDIEMEAKQALYGERYPIDPEFIAALAHGMPPSGGIALGVDRLVMLCTGASDIKQVQWAPVSTEKISD